MDDCEEQGGCEMAVKLLFVWKEERRAVQSLLLFLLLMCSLYHGLNGAYGGSR